ncbi:MAG TPA: DUF2058 family protein [Rudaea sp.]|nr:DUF2058 family protein [Rudaea sp.]
MSDSLRDQLLKSGLVQKLRSEAKPAPPRKPERRPDGGKPAAPRKPDGHAETRKPAPPGAPAPATSAAELHERDLARAYALRARQEKEERERAQRDAERAAREKRERKQKLAALLDGKAQNANDADLPRHFPHGNKIRRVYCTAEQLPRLNRGELAIVQLAGRYLLVARDVALQAQAIQPEALVLLCDPNAPAEDDVPADLVW